MYSFDGLLGGGSGGGGGADAKRARNFFPPSVFRQGPITVPSANVKVSAIITTLVYFVRQKCRLGIDLLREGIFFLAIDPSFLRKPQSV
jgi:hypothetical protein